MSYMNIQSIISAQVTTGTVTSVTFSSIPQTFDSLMIYITGYMTTNNYYLDSITWNSLSANYSYVTVRRATASGASTATQDNSQSTSAANINLNTSAVVSGLTGGDARIWFPYYTKVTATAGKRVFGDLLQANTAATPYTLFAVDFSGRNTDTAAITSIVLNGSFPISTRIVLYGQM